MRRTYACLFFLLLLTAWTHALRGQLLVADYTFDGTAKDASLTGNHAQVHGVTPIQDRFGVANRAFGFDGIQSYVLAPNAPELQSSAITVSFWVRVDDMPDQGEVFLMSHGGWQERWKISLPSHGKPVWTTNHTNGISDMDSGDGNALQEGVWTHVAFVHDGAQDLIYVNGALANTKAVVGDLNATTMPLGIGYEPIGGGLFFNGGLDDVQIYNGALDANAINLLYTAQSTPPTFGNGVVADYRFTGNTLDASAYRNHAKSVDLTYRPDRFGFGNSAASFNGESTTVTAANSAHLNSPTTTVAIWINADALPGNGESFIASFGGWQERWKISLPTHGKLVWTTNHTNGISDMDAGDANVLQPGTWTHAVFVHDGTKDYIYINGVLAAEKDVVGDLNSTGYDFGLGYNVVDGGNYFDGSLDDVLVYNYALSAQDIADLYASQSAGGFNPNDELVFNAPFTGSFEDESQFGNDPVSDKATLTADRFGYANNAVYLDGTASLEAANSVQYNSDYTTVSFWVNLVELPGSGEVFLLSHGGWQERWKISLPSHGKPVWTTNHSGGISDMDSGDGNALVPGTWTHVAVSHGPNFDRIYINGQLAAEKSVGGTLNDTKYPLGIGYNPIDGGNYMNGSIDEVRLYNTELTPGQILALFNDQSAPPVFTSNVVADYHLDGNAFDASEYRNHGKVEGATATRNHFGQANHAMFFDGGDAISAANSPQLNSPTATVAFWVNVNTLPGNGEAYLVSLGGWQERYKISLPTHGRVVWTTNHENGISDMDAGNGNELIPGEWTHLVFVHDGLKDYIYIDGQLAAEKDVVGLLSSTSHPLGIGYNIIDGGSYFDGSLDNLVIYNTALNADEVLQLYTDEISGPGVTDNVAPDAPLCLTAHVEFTNVTLNWLPSLDDDSGLAAYNVYLDGVIAETTTETTYDFKGLLPLTTYEMGVSAVDSAGNESTISSITVTTGPDETPDTEAPSKPANLAITAGSNSVVFSWDASTDNTAVAGYVVFVDGELIDTVDAPGTSLFITGLDPSTLYTFEVYAFDFAGNNSEVADITESTTDPIDTGEEGLVAHYPFEGNANDATPYNNHGVPGGDPTFEPVTNRPNASGLSIVFDGDQDSVLAPNAVQLISDFTTVSFWIRVDGINLADAESYILDFGHWDERWKISLPQHRQIVWTTNSKNAQFDHFISDMDSGAGNDLVLGFWWYVTMVHDGTDDIIYLDGVEVNRKPAMGTLNSTARPLGMGNNPIDGGQYFEGSLDELKIYNKALTASEIETLYETGTTGFGDIPNEVHKYVELVYPNPTTDDLAIKHGFTTSQDLLVRIFDAQGRQVGVKEINAADMQGQLINMNVAGITPGTYSLNFVLGGKNLGSIPFVKQ